MNAEPGNPGPGTGPLGPALALIARERWSAAIAALEALAGTDQRDPRIAVYLHYARGRQHQERGNRVDAHIEYRRALDIDPAFEDARRAAQGMSRRPSRRGDPAD